MRVFLRPLPRAVTRPVSVVLMLAWAAVMAVLINRSYLQASSSLATDLARYGSAATWRGVYYRGEKIGFTVSPTVPTDEGFDLQEDGRLQMSLLGATTAATLRTTAHVDRAFALRAFEFSLDPGTGPVQVHGRIDGRRLSLDITTPSGTRRDVRELEEAPALSQNISRRLANGRLKTGARYQWMVFDPATLRNSRVNVEVGRRELVRGAGATPLPAFRVEMEFAGLKTSSWITDTGEVVREESARTDHRARVRRQRPRDGGVAADAGRSAAGGCGRPADGDASPGAARRAADAHSSRRRRFFRGRSRWRRPTLRRWHSRAARPAGPETVAGRSGHFTLSRGRSVHRERRPRDRR